MVRHVIRRFAGRAVVVHEFGWKPDQIANLPIVRSTGIQKIATRQDTDQHVVCIQHRETLVLSSRD